MDIVSIFIVYFIIISHSIMGIITFGRVRIILSQESSNKTNYQKWYIDMAIALLLAVFLPIPFIIFHEFIGEYENFKGINFKIKRPEFDDIAWQECNTASINTIWPNINYNMEIYLRTL